MSRYDLLSKENKLLRVKLYNSRSIERIENEKSDTWFFRHHHALEVDDFYIRMETLSDNEVVRFFYWKELSRKNTENIFRVGIIQFDSIISGGDAFGIIKSKYGYTRMHSLLDLEKELKDLIDCSHGLHEVRNIYRRGTPSVL
jgi:hypothetical protein